MSRRSDPHPRRAGRAVHAALLGATVIFGVNYTVAKVTMVEIPPLALVWLRVVIPVAVLHLARHLTAPGVRLQRRDLPWFALLALLGVVFNQLFFLLGLHLSTPINASVLMTTIPITTALFAIALRREGATVPKFLGIAVAFVGAAYLMGGLHFDFSGENLAGDLLVLLNSLSYGLFLVLGRDVVRRYPAVTFLAWVFTFGAVIVLPLGLPELLRLDPRSLSRRAWLGAGYVVVFTTLVAHYLNSWSLRRAESSTVGVYVYVQPVVAAGCSIAFLGEALRWEQGIAAACIFFGLWLTALRTGWSAPVARERGRRAATGQNPGNSYNLDDP